MANRIQDFRLLALGCAVLAACQAPEGSERIRGPGTEDLLVSSADGYPCTLEFQPTGIVLETDVEGSVPDPTVPVSLGPDGRFAARVAGGGRIGLWSRDGTFLDTIGRPGEGPGELGASPLPLFDEAGHLHVLDPTQARWSRFAPDGEFLESTTSPELSHLYLTHRIALISGASVLVGTPSPLSSHPFHFRILSFDGGTRGFSELPGEPSSSYGRPVTRPSGGTFWAGPWQGDPEYALEEWALDGRLLRRIRLEPPWDVGEDAGSSSNSLPRFPMLAEGPGGELIVLAVASAPDDLDSVEVWYEVVDPGVPDVLASKRLLVDGSGYNVPPMFGMEEGTRLGFRQATDELGLPLVEMIEYELVPVGTRADSLACAP